MLSRRVTLALSAAGAAAALAAGGSAIASNEPEESSAPGPSPAAAIAPIGEVQVDQSAAFRVFRRPRRASDAIPAEVAAAMAGPGRFGRNPGLSRAVETTTGRGWVVPGRGVVCLIAPRPSSGYVTTCNATADAAEDGLRLQIISPEESSSSTLLPDGGRVVVAQDDATTKTVQPDTSGMANADTTDAERVTVITEDGRSTVPVPEADGTVAPTG